MFNDYNKFREQIEYARGAFLDEEQTRELAKALFDKEIIPDIPQLQESDPEKLEQYFRFALERVLRGIEIIFAHAESPIEQIFFNSVNFIANVSMYPLRFHEPIQFKPNTFKRLAETRERANLMVDWYLQNRESLAGTHNDIDEFKEWLGELNEFSESFKYDIKSQFAGRNYYHTQDIFIQAELIDIIPNSPSPYRADALILSDDLKKKLVVECDGFLYHKEKPIFTRDRQKDRFLKAKGFDILRFSGSEINDDARECGFQLVHFLFP